MSLELSIEAQALLDQGNISGNIILEIDGFPNLFGSIKVTRISQYGDEIYYGDGSVFGGSTEDASSIDYISLDGTTNNITQKLEQDKGGGSSITSFKIRLVDFNNEITSAFSPGVTVPDILGRDAIVYWQSKGSKHPEDSARLFVGVISSSAFGAGYAEVRVDHPEQLKRQELLPKTTTKLSADLTDVATLALLESSAGFINDQENLTSYIRIGDEIIKVQSFATDTAFNLTRAQFGTIAAAHTTGDEVESFYRLQGDTIELALRLLLSDGEGGSFATRTASRFVNVSASLTVAGGIYFDTPNIQDELGLVVGDFIAVTAGATGSNLFGYSAISGFGKVDGGSYITVTNSLLPETDVTATCLFKSKYNKLNFGCNLKPFQVDVEQFEYLQTAFSANFFEYDFPIKDEINAKEFIDEQILYPSGLFSLPRKGRVSAGISAPPIVGPNVKTINADTVTNPTSLTMSRSINTSFYNSIVYKIAEDFVEDKLLGATVAVSNDSTNRINIGARTLNIEAKGIVDNDLNRNKIEDISSRLLDRYQYGAESLSVDVNFKTAFSIEPGDTVIVDGESLGLSDITRGNRDFAPRVMEVVNKSINLKTGKASLDLQDTNLSTLRRYGSWAPSSKVGAGSTTTSLIIKRSYGTIAPAQEKTKWEDYLLQDIVVRSEDHSIIYTSKLVGFSNSNPNELILNPALGGIPSEDFVLEPPPYDDTSTTAMQFYKSLHCFWNPQVEATGGSTTTITVEAGDADKFLVGAPLRIHLEDYSESALVKVLEVSGTTITIDETIGFTVTSSHLVDLIGFKDGGSPFSWY